MSTKDLEESLTITKYTLLFSGIKMEASDWDLGVKILFLFNFLWLNTDVIGEFCWLVEGVQLGKSFQELSYIAPCATICLLSTAKTIPFYCNQNIFIEVFNKLKAIHPKEDDEQLNQDIEINVKESIRFLKNLIRMHLTSCSIVVLAFCFLPISAMAYTYAKTGMGEVIFPFPIKYFFDPYSRKMWPLVYFHQVWSTFIAFTNVFGTDTFFYAFCVYTKMHFRILQRRFQNAVASWSIESPEDGKKQFVDVVKSHQQLIYLVDQVEILYSKSTLFNIVSSSLLICLSGFNVTSLEDPGVVISFLAFLFMSLTQIFLLCYFGDMLMRSSMEISDAIYSSVWYQVDQGTKKNILFVLARTRKPCRLTAANFADVNLRAFTTILSRSWSYFALLKTVYK